MDTRGVKSYVIVEGVTPRELDRNVNKRIDEGWVPLGAPTITVVEGCDKFFCSQAMVIFSDIKDVSKH